LEPPSTNSLFSHLESLPDPRRAGSVEHPLSSVRFIAVCAVICGADSWKGMAKWGEAKKLWLSTFLDLPHGIPSHDTFRRIFILLSPSAFATTFAAWMKDAVSLVEGAVVALDGKCLRRSRCRADGKAAIHIVSAFADQNRVVIGQVKTEEKSNEITAIPELLKLLELQGCLVTLDAMGCQKTIAATIQEQGADYLISVKGNQPTLHHIVQETLAIGLDAGVESFGGGHVEEIEHCSGATIVREVWVMPAPDDLCELAMWLGIASMVLARRTVRKGDEESVGERWFISTVPADKAQRLHHAVRAHWGIENRLHWSLDVAFDEDHCRIRAGYSAENMARLRHIAINLLKQEKTAKAGIKIKRGMAGWDNQYLLKVLGGA
jgi:predicted transposase YbfD/YdcC